MTDEERIVFEELLETARIAVHKLGKPLPLEVILSFSMPFVQAANRAEKILDPFRSPAERARVERGAYS